MRREMKEPKVKWTSKTYTWMYTTLNVKLKNNFLFSEQNIHIYIIYLRIFIYTCHVCVPTRT